MKWRKVSPIPVGGLVTQRQQELMLASQKVPTPSYDSSGVVVSAGQVDQRVKEYIPPGPTRASVSSGKVGSAPGSASAPGPTCASVSTDEVGSQPETTVPQREEEVEWESGEEEPQHDEQPMAEEDVFLLAESAVPAVGLTAAKHRADHDTGVGMCSSDELPRDAYPKFLQPDYVRQTPRENRRCSN